MNGRHRRWLSPQDIVLRSEGDAYAADCDACAGMGDLEGDLCGKCGGAGVVPVLVRRRPRLQLALALTFLAGAAIGAQLFWPQYSFTWEACDLIVGVAVLWNWRRIVRWLNQ